jgi:aminoglycoside 3-N-acetyltransferase
LITGSDRRALAAHLEALGLAGGDIVLVHASLRQVAPRPATALTVIQAVLDVLGPGGTLVVPTQTAWNSTTSRIHREAVAALSTREELEYRMTLPRFDPRTTPSSGMGALAEGVRTLPGAYRSTHPQTSFAAVGRRAEELTAVHDLECHLGPRSPMGALYEADALVLLLGIGYSVCTMFHLAEYRYAPRPKRRYECRIADVPGDGWIEFEDIELDDGEFGRLGKEFEHATGQVRVGPVGHADSRLFGARDAVDFAVQWMRRFAP